MRTDNRIAFIPEFNRRGSRFVDILPDTISSQSDMHPRYKSLSSVNLAGIGKVDIVMQVVYRVFYTFVLRSRSLVS